MSLEAQQLQPTGQSISSANIEFSLSPELIHSQTREISLYPLNPEMPINRQNSIIPEHLLSAFQNPDLTEEEKQKLMIELQLIGEQFAQEQQLSPENKEIILAAIAQIPREIKNNLPPKVIFDLETGSFKSEYFPLARAFDKIKLGNGPSDITINIMANDSDEILVFKRSFDNGVCRGFIGPVAGYLNDVLGAETINDLIETNIFEQIGHEVGLKESKLKEVLSYKVIGLVDFDYPGKQNGVVVTARINLSKAEIFASIKENQGQGIGKLAEKHPFFIPRAKILSILADPDCHIASSHAVAIAATLGETPEWHQAIELIKKLPVHPSGNKPEEAWNGLEALLEKYEIDVVQTV